MTGFLSFARGFSTYTCSLLKDSSAHSSPSSGYEHTSLHVVLGERTFSPKTPMGNTTPATTAVSKNSLLCYPSLRPHSRVRLEWAHSLSPGFGCTYWLLLLSLYYIVAYCSRITRNFSIRQLRQATDIPRSHRLWLIYLISLYVMI